MSNELRRIFVTGATTGLGEGLARHYAAEGVTLGLVARREALLLERAAELRESGAKVELYVGDVADTAFMAASARHFTEAAGGVDLVIANAGVTVPDRIAEGESEPVAWLMNVNVVGVTNTLVPFVPVMLSQRSGILCSVGSVAGHRALPGRAAYSASKACVKTFMDALRMQLRGSGVHAMTLCPGFVVTPLTAHNPSMLFPLDVASAIEQMTRAIARRTRTFTFPWQARLLSHLLRWAPESVVLRGVPKPPPPRPGS